MVNPVSAQGLKPPSAAVGQHATGASAEALVVSAASKAPAAAAIVASTPASAASGGEWAAVSSYADVHPQVASSIISAGGTVLVGAITLIGVGISLAHAHHRMKRELQAQRDLASEERDYAARQAVQTRLTEMRQDLYLGLID